MSRRFASSIVVADHPLRNRLAELVALLAARRDAIAEADLTIASLREGLFAFEQRYHTQLGEAHAELRQVTRLLRHIAQLITLLQGPKLSQGQLHQRIEHINRRKQAEIDAPRADKKKPLSTPAEHKLNQQASSHPQPDTQRRLKRAFIALVRRYHPDLAQKEGIRQRNGRLMVRINTLYKTGDVVRLEAMVDQAEATEAGQHSLEMSHWDDLQGQVDAAQDRLSWFDTVLKNLENEHRMLVRSPTFALRQRIEAQSGATQDPVNVYQSLRCEVASERDGALAQVPTAMRTLESTVDQFNAQNVPTAEQASEQKLRTCAGGPSTLARFEPHCGKSLVRLGLTQLAALHAAPHIKQQATQLCALSQTSPSTARLILLTYVAELSPQPLPALETFGAVAKLLAHTSCKDTQPLSLQEALVVAERDVEYAVRTTPTGLAFVGLKFRRPTLHEAVPLALRDFSVRQLFAQLLLHLGEQRRCASCNQMVWAIPLYRLLGLDNLRALVCPLCATTLTSYFLPKGRDIQAVLNDAFLDFDLIEQVTCRLADSSIVMQMLPLEIAQHTIATLKARLVADVFLRHNIAISVDQVLLYNEEGLLKDDVPLALLADKPVEVLFAEKATMRPDEALETLRFRISHRFNTPAGRQ